MTLQDEASELLRLHQAPELLVMVNVWDVASARVVAAQSGCRAIATASHSIADSHGYPDGEQIPLDLMIAAIARIAAAVDVPVSADLEAGYGDTGTTVRRAIGAGAVGGNLEDQMRPLAESVAMVADAVQAGEAEGVPFVVNARTDAYLLGSDRDAGDLARDAIERGRAFLDAGAGCVFVPGRLDRDTIARLVEGIGERRISVLAGPGAPSQAELTALGVARISYGPWTQRVVMAAFADLAADLFAGGALPRS